MSSWPHCHVKGFEILGERAPGTQRDETGVTMALAPNYSGVITPAPPQLKPRAVFSQRPLSCTQKMRLEQEGTLGQAPANLLCGLRKSTEPL